VVVLGNQRAGKCDYYLGCDEKGIDCEGTSNLKTDG
jgi:hypothetical protein